MNSKNFKTALWITTYGLRQNVIAPGTIGSLIGLILAFCVSQIAYCAPFANQPLIKYGLALLIIVGLFTSGIYYCNIYVDYVGREDPKEVIIDEVAGQLLTIWLCWPSLRYLKYPGFNFDHYPIGHFMVYWVVPFLLFRFFDIKKTWPIGWVDRKIKGGIGIMLDDIFAALMAAMVQYSIIFILTCQF